jgi:hypothetical protein
VEGGAANVEEGVEGDAPCWFPLLAKRFPTIATITTGTTTIAIQHHIGILRRDGHGAIAARGAPGGSARYTVQSRPSK